VGGRCKGVNLHNPKGEREEKAGSTWTISKKEGGGEGLAVGATSRETAERKNAGLKTKKEEGRKRCDESVGNMGKWAQASEGVVPRNSKGKGARDSRRGKEDFLFILRGGGLTHRRKTGRAVRKAGRKIEEKEVGSSEKGDRKGS